MLLEKSDHHSMRISETHHSVPTNEPYCDSDSFNYYFARFCPAIPHTPKDHHTITPVCNLFYGPHYFFGSEEAAKMTQREAQSDASAQSNAVESTDVNAELQMSMREYSRMNQRDFEWLCQFLSELNEVLTRIGSPTGPVFHYISKELFSTTYSRTGNRSNLQNDRSDPTEIFKISTPNTENLQGKFPVLLGLRVVYPDQWEIYEKMERIESSTGPVLTKYSRTADGTNLQNVRSDSTKITSASLKYRKSTMSPRLQNV
ncbi:unnamed protein product [Caenorhabditis brenneri]